MFSPSLVRKSISFNTVGVSRRGLVNSYSLLLCRCYIYTNNTWIKNQEEILLYKPVARLDASRSLSTGYFHLILSTTGLILAPVDLSPVITAMPLDALTKNMLGNEGYAECTTHYQALCTLYEPFVHEQGSIFCYLRINSDALCHADTKE